MNLRGLLFVLLIESVLGGDVINISSKEIVEKYGDMVYRIAISHVKHREDAEDIFQEVFISLIKNLGSIENERHLKHWLIRTTINKSKNLHLCFWKKRVYFDLDENSQKQQNASNDEASAIENNIIEINELRETIKLLSKKQQSVVYLYYYEDYQVKEIAEILGISEGTVKSRLSSARMNLKEALERG